MTDPTLGPREPLLAAFAWRDAEPSHGGSGGPGDHDGGGNGGDGPGDDGGDDRPRPELLSAALAYALTGSLARLEAEDEREIVAEYQIACGVAAHYRLLRRLLSAHGIDVHEAPILLAPDGDFQVVRDDEESDAEEDVQALLRDVRRYMRSNRISTADLSEEIGVSAHTLERWLAGRAQPGRRSRRRLAAAIYAADM